MQNIHSDRSAKWTADSLKIDLMEVSYNILTNERQLNERAKACKKRQARQAIEQYFENKLLHHQIADAWSLDC